MNFGGWLDTILRDLKYTFRMLARTPGFTAVAVLTLALGIGANTAIFTLLDQILLRLLPVKDPQQLVLLTMRGRHYGQQLGRQRDLVSDVPGLPGSQRGLLGNVLPLSDSRQPYVRGTGGARGSRAGIGN